MNQSWPILPSTNPRAPITIEVCVDSVDSALAAIRGGADRLEICGNLGLGGGTTPSIGLVKSIRDACLGVPLVAMVRPRAGDFLYSDAEINVMAEDIQQFKHHGIQGVAFGTLNRHGTIDIKMMNRLMDISTEFGLEVCFHRAFDLANDLPEALTTIMQLSHVPTRILTSGGGTSALSSLDTLEHLCKRIQVAGSSDRSGIEPTKIMPGSGINAKTVGLLLKRLLPFGLSEIHLSGGHWVDSEMLYRPDGMGMGTGGAGEWSVWKTSEKKIRNVRHAVDIAWKEYLDSR